MAKSKASTDDFSQQTPYGGMHGRDTIETAPHLLVCGPTGSQKTTGVLAPGALMWRGPRVLVSSKTDFLGWVVQKGISNRGPLYIMDLAGELHDDISWLKDADYTLVKSDPTSLIMNSDDAMAMSSLLMKVGGLGASDNGGGGGDDAFWQTLAAQPLAALLEAGRASGRGMSWVTQAVSRPEAPEGDGDADDYDLDTPSWHSSYELVQHISPHAPDLLAVAAMDPKMRDSLTATMKAGLTPWLLSNVLGQEGAVPFAPKMLEGPGEPTLAIIAPADGVAAGAAVGAIETIIRHWRRGVDRGLPRVLLSIDELVNTAPIPKLPTYITEARGLGVAVVAAVQSSNQLALRWGETGAKILAEVFPAVMVLYGAPERQLLEDAAWLDGEEDVVRETIDAQAKRSVTTERAPRTHATSLLPTKVGQGRLLLGRRKGLLVDLPGIWLF